MAAIAPQDPSAETTEQSPLPARVLAAIVLLGIVLLPFAAIAVGLALYAQGDGGTRVALADAQAGYRAAPSAPDLARVPVPDQGIPFTNTVRGDVYPLWEMSRGRQITDQGEPVWVDGRGQRAPLPTAWDEDFWNPASGWVGGGAGGYAQGEYRVLSVGSTTAHEIAWHPRELKNMVARVDAHLDRTTQGIGLLLGFRFRQQSRGGDGYVFTVVPDTGTFRLERWQVENGSVARRKLIDDTPSAAIWPGTAWNRLAVLVDGLDVTLWINGVPVGRTRIDSVGSGGLVVGVTKEEGVSPLATGDARFARLLVREVE